MALATVPQLDSLFLTDAGLETDVIFNRGIDLPHFAAITLLRSPEGIEALTSYFRGFLNLAARMHCGIALESATWRASPDWAEPLGLSHEGLAALNVAAMDLLLELRNEYRAAVPAIVVSGCVGPRGDGYKPGRVMSADDAESYHFHQTSVMAAAGADQITAITMTNPPEAIGIVRAAKRVGAPVAISFTVETDGSLPTGGRLADAIDAVDYATDAYSAYFMINCAHPTHFIPVLEDGADWTRRLGGLRANASRCSHAELEVMTELDSGSPEELAAEYSALRQRFPHINVLGGCCGTDVGHITAIAETCLRKA